MKKLNNENEDEKFSYWDYIDKKTLFVIILIVSLGCLVVGAIYLQTDFPAREESEEPEPYHMGLMPNDDEWEYNATHVWRKGEG